MTWAARHTTRRCPIRPTAAPQPALVATATDWSS